MARATGADKDSSDSGLEVRAGLDGPECRDSVAARRSGHNQCRLRGVAQRQLPAWPLAAKRWHRGLVCPRPDPLLDLRRELLVGQRPPRECIDKRIDQLLASVRWQRL